MADPQSWRVVVIFFTRSVCTSVQAIAKQITSENSDGTVDQAEGIIDDTNVFYFAYIQTQH